MSGWGEIFSSPLMAPLAERWGKTPRSRAGAMILIERTFTYNAFNRTGENESATGTVEGDTLTWLADDTTGGQTMKGRFTMKILSPTADTYKFENAPDGGNQSQVDLSLG